MKTIQLFSSKQDAQTCTMKRLLQEKKFHFDEIWTPDTDAPYIVICGIEPIHYEDFLIWISEQVGDGEVTFKGKHLTDLGFVP